jgi:cytochrome P450
LLKHTAGSPIGGTTIPAGAQVIISLAAANRYRDRYPDADTLDIDRPGVRHLAFGHGIHHCFGAALARMEGQLALGSLLRRFPQLRLAPPPSCAGATATASCCAACPSCQSFRDRPRTASQHDPQCSTAWPAGQVR